MKFSKICRTSVAMEFKILRNPYVQMHTAVLLWGFTAILGDLISLSAVVLVWWRVGLTALALGLIPAVRLELSSLSRVALRKFVFFGFLIGFHWICFYGSIKLANASIALISFSTMALFTAFLEPILLRRKMNRVDILFGAGVIPGVAIIVKGLEGAMFTGFLVGLLAAVLMAFLAIMNKKYIAHASALAITFIEMSSAWILISCLLPIIYLTADYSFWPDLHDAAYLMILVVICTILPFFLQLKSLTKLSAFSTNLAFNMEPVYGIVLAAFILKDFTELNVNFYLGAGLVLIFVLGYPLLRNNT